MTSKYDKRAIDFCTGEKQQQNVEALIRLGSPKLAGEERGIAPAAINRSYKIAKAVMDLAAPVDDQVPGGLPNTAFDHVSNVAATPERRKYIVTSAQNATPVNTQFFDALKAFCHEENAELIAVPFRYRNPTSLWSDNDEGDDWWAPEIAGHLVSEDIELNENLLLAGGVRVQPTAVDPVSGLQSYPKGRSMVVGHTKRRLVSVATPHGEYPQLIMTTGAITEPNYTDTKAGRIGHHHHTTGALIVETEGDLFWARQVTANEDGSFTDLDNLYAPDGWEPAPRATALTLGDIHLDQLDEEVEAATLAAKNSLQAKVDAEEIDLHDALDFRSRNHHEEGDPFHAVRKAYFGHDCVYSEVSRLCNWLNWVSGLADRVNVIESNHNEAFLRWLKEGRAGGAKDPVNAWFYHASMEMLLPPPFDPSREIPHYLQAWFSRIIGDDAGVKNPLFHDRTVRLEKDGVERGMHGDIGPSGARGSTKAFDKIGVKSTSGHCHGPEIFGGVYRAGVSGTLEMEYASRGPGNWLHSHVIQYADGERAIVHMIGGRFWMEQNDDF